MLQFACDWCKSVKDPSEIWILGMAAESVGVTAARREIAILSSWDYDRAVHPLAVHFCSEKHKDNYMAALFEVAPAEAEVEIETTATVPAHAVEKRIKRTIKTPVANVTVKKKVKKARRTSARRRAS